MQIDELKKIKKISIFVDNEKIEGEILEVDKWGKITISVPPTTKTIPVELGKRGEIFFTHENKEFFIEGKIFSQGLEKMIFISETEILTEKRKDERFLTPLVQVRLTAKTGIFHREEISGSLIDISLSGAKIETSLPLKEKVVYEFITSFLIKKKLYPFYAKVELKYTKKLRNVFISGLKFVEIEPPSKGILEKYIKELKHELGKDTLNY